MRPQNLLYMSRHKIVLGLTPIECRTLLAIMSYEATHGHSILRAELFAFLPHHLPRPIIQLKRMGLIGAFMVGGKQLLHTWPSTWKWLGFEPPEHLKVPGAYVGTEKAA
jgi:hypothetical protein